MVVKNLFRKPDIFLIIPLLFVMFLDFGFTLLGQPSSYWQDYNQVQESNPLAGYFLSAHPLYFVLASLFYLLIILILLAKLPKNLKLILGTVVFLIHAWAVSTWIYLKFSDYNFFLVIIYLVILGMITAMSISFWHSQKYYGD